MFVVIGDGDSHIELGVKCAKATTMFGAIILAKFRCAGGATRETISRKPHTVSCKVADKYGSVTVRMMLPPMGSSVVATRVPKKVLKFAGIEDVFTSSRGSTKTLSNFVKSRPPRRGAASPTRSKRDGSGSGEGSSFAGLPLDALFEILLLCGLVARQQPEGDLHLPPQRLSAVCRGRGHQRARVLVEPVVPRSIVRQPGLRRITSSPPTPR
uniref:Small ribosomal subunit protein uS5 C-terminal domain-containing protein n=1 Tax=Oryza nivara TaxID=4536 RepID=A0A0E0HZJ6_ORYNI